MHQGDGRSYIARSKTKYNLVWYVAPDSYAATNAASSGAFVLSESYLYTSEMIKTTLQHLTDNGIMVVQFGELDFQDRRTAPPLRRDRTRGAAGARRQGSEQPPPRRARQRHAGDLPTIMVKRTAFTPAESARLAKAIPTKPVIVHSNGHVDHRALEPAVRAGRPHGTHIVAGSPRRRATTAARRRGDVPADDQPRARRQAVLLALRELRQRVQHILQPIHGGLRSGELGRRTGAAVVARDLGVLRGRVPAAAVLLRASRVPVAAGAHGVGAVLRRARARVHPVRGHDDPAPHRGCSVIPPIRSRSRSRRCSSRPGRARS